MMAGYGTEQEELFQVPQSFESPEGIWRQCLSPVYRQPVLTTKELASLTPPIARLNFSTVRGGSREVSRQSSAVENGNANNDSILSNSSGDSFLVFNCHHNVHVHVNDGLASEPLTYNSRGQEYPTSHDFEQMTRTEDHLELAIGFSTGEIVVYEYHSKKPRWINHRNDVIKRGCSCLRFIPGHEGMLLASYTDGSLLIFNTALTEGREFVVPKDAAPGFHFLVNKDKSVNPVCTWKRTPSQHISDMAISPDVEHVATVDSGGLLAVYEMDLKDGQPPVIATLFVTKSYYGALLCVAWSPDAKYIAVGGEDDAVSIYDVNRAHLMARCIGHTSYVSRVVFDPYLSNTETIYRLGSVGMDCKLALWDFSVDALQAPVRQTSSAQLSEATPQKSPRRLRLRRRSEKHTTSASKPVNKDTVIPCPSRLETAKIEPVTLSQLHSEPVTDVAFHKKVLYTLSQDGVLLLWQRPEKFKATAV
eukprot:TRINITY_DN8367_c0_g1_i1.p1 TRINITY_DN8367_c0_g1~~TRINITY_DN8367_c0_g1_i1.p1  ORF type:complete len:476 (+),score=69.55 TRINITY_DN8367_c0_g1_i1:146-1573(+)